MAVSPNWTDQHSVWQFSLHVQIGVCRVLEQLGPKASPAIDKLVDVLETGTVSARSWASIVLGAIGESDKHDILALLTKRLTALSLGVRRWQLKQGVGVQRPRPCLERPALRRLVVMLGELFFGAK